MNNKIVPDTSVIIEGALRTQIEKGKLKGKELLLHEAVFAELEHQANQGRSTGLIGLDELEKIQESADKTKVKLRICGKRPTGSEIRYAGT